jgi:hypothetical protein
MQPSAQWTRISQSVIEGLVIGLIPALAIGVSFPLVLCCSGSLAKYDDWHGAGIHRLDPALAAL